MVDGRLRVALLAMLAEGRRNGELHIAVCSVESMPLVSHTRKPNEQVYCV
jgi:hypothetical protein